jgi:ubiquinone/menaquinone biosynthesis C-methylase UbiE
MKPSLAEESEKLLGSWTRHDAGMLRDYLVAGVEDPRLNLQSVLSRHFLVRALTAERFAALMEAECRFAAVMNWLAGLARRLSDPEEPAAILHALRRGADNAEGIEIPQFALESFAALPAVAGELTVPNYLESFLSEPQFVAGRLQPHQASLDTFTRLWSRALVAEGPQSVSVLEAACGSANDYRCLHACSLARLLDYTGFDLCPANVENVCALFPGVRFRLGNVFAIAEPDKSFDLCFVHDLFEHLSLEGMRAAVAEVCRVTRRGLCIGFFNMDETREHVVEPFEEYHWNKLSMARMRELFAEHGFATQAIHIGTFLHRQVGCEETHNPNAYTFLLHAESL